MRRYFKYFIVFIFMLFLVPISSNAKTSKFTYGINGINISEDKMIVNGWAYKTFINFCNSDNQNYNNYEMKDKSGNNVGIASRCGGKGFDSVQYKLYLHSDNGNVKNIYAVKRDGTSGNLRRIGISATCVNYYKPTVDGKAEHCDGALATFGEFPSEPIDYYRRNYNVQNRVNNYSEGTYFYDDIGFIGVFNMADLQDDVTYTLYLSLTINGRTEEIPVAAPGLTVSIDGKLVTQSKTSNKITVKSDYDNFVLNYSPDVGQINQDAGSVYYKKGNGFAQFTKSLGGGYFTPYRNYTIKSILLSQNASIVGNHERIGGFDFYNLGTTGSFTNDYTTPGKNYTYYAISPWVEIEGSLKLSKNKINQSCGGTKEGSTARKNYCNQATKPSDYAICCNNLICGGTSPNTRAREEYCTNNPNDGACCSSGGNCPIETTDKLDPVDPTYYTYWNQASTEDTGYRVVTGTNTTVKDYPKYCAATDSTSTMLTTDEMLRQYNNAFCYQKGSFATTSPNQADYILTYSGGAYSLNTNYDTDLVCVSLANRRVTNVKYYDENCNYKGQSGGDNEVHFLDDNYNFDKSDNLTDESLSFWTTCTTSNSCPPEATNCPSTVTYPCKETIEWKSSWDYTSTDHLGYNRVGKFSIDVLEAKLKEVPQLYLTDTTINQKVAKFDVNTTVEKDTQTKLYSQNNASLMLDYIEEKQSKDSSFSDPLAGMTKSTFVQKLQLKRYINADESSIKEKSFGSKSYSCRSTTLTTCTGEDAYKKFVEECDNKWETLSQTIEYASNHYYGTLNLNYENVSEKEHTGKCGELTCTDRYKYTCKYKFWYEGEVTKTMYVTIEDTYKEESIKLNANYTLNPNSVPDEIKERFEESGEKYVSQVNLSDYYQITLGSSDYNSSDGKYFGVAGTWNMDKALCALDVTDHYCNPEEATCACKYDKKGNLEKGVYYSDCLDFRIVSVSSLFPGKGSSLCVNPTSNCRQPGRNWLYVSNDFKRTDNFNYTKDKPMYHITLTPSTMNKIASDYKEYYTNIDLGGWYNPSKCTYNGNSRCSSDYESSILNSLGSSVFTRNYDIINTRYRILKNMPGVNVYKTSRDNGEGD